MDPNIETVVGIEITNACNLNCKLCTKVEKKNRKIWFISINDIKKILNKFSKEDLKKFNEYLKIFNSKESIRFNKESFTGKKIKELPFSKENTPIGVQK